MHIPDGFLSPPVIGATMTVGAVATGWALRESKKSLTDHQVPLLGVTAAFVFAAQMINFPIVGGTCGHFMGTALVALLLGWAPGILIFGVILTLQAFLFADGGITALGANLFNLGVVGIGSALLTHKALLRVPGVSQNVAVGVASWVSVVAASITTAACVGWSGTAPMPVVMFAMTSVHAVIGVGEALVTVAALNAVSAARPDLFRVEPAQVLAGGE